MKVGDSIVYGDLKPDTLRKGVITKESRDFFFTDNQHRPEDCIYKAYCWPTAAEPELLAILIENARLQKELDNRMKLVYELRNRVNRGEFVA